MASAGISDEFKKKLEQSFSKKSSFAKTSGSKSTTTSKCSTQQVDSLVASAVEKKWTSLKVNGTEEFKEAVWSRAKTAGIAIEGYTPTKQALERYEQAQKRHAKGAGFLHKFFNKLDSKQTKTSAKLSLHRGYAGGTGKLGEQVKPHNDVKPCMATRFLKAVNRVVDHPAIQIPLLVGAYCTGPAGCMTFGAIMAAKKALTEMAAVHDVRKEQLKKVKEFTKAGFSVQAKKIKGTSRWNYLAPVIKMGTTVGLSYAGGAIVGSIFGAGTSGITDGLGSLGVKVAAAGACFTVAMMASGKSARTAVATTAAIGLGAVAACYVGGGMQPFWWGENGTRFLGGNPDASITQRLASWSAHVK